MATTVVITGASAGIGRAVALEFARQGCNVALVARGVERLESAAHEARAFGVAALAIPADVADGDIVDAAAERVESELGPVDVWVNNAMATVFAPARAVRFDEYRRVTEVTYLGQVHGTLAALRCMRRRNRGTIVQVGSALSYRAVPLQSAYCAAKFAVRGFTDSLRSELAHEGSRIRLTMVQLPAVNTPQFDWARSRMAQRAQPLPPIFQPEAVAPEIVRAAREAPRELWIGHSTLRAIAGAMFLPQTGDRILAQQGYAGPVSAGHDTVHPDNLFSPPPGDPGTRGRFNAEAHTVAAGFDPAAVHSGGLFLMLMSLAGAFAAGALVKGWLADKQLPAPDGAARRFQGAQTGRPATARLMPVGVARAKRQGPARRDNAVNMTAS
jgi:short-subunit dehydrogenase